MGFRDQSDKIVTDAPSEKYVFAKYADSLSLREGPSFQADEYEKSLLIILTTCEVNIDCC